VHVIFDFSKAFDTVNRNLLVTKPDHFIRRQNYLMATIKDILMQNEISMQDTLQCR